MELKHYLQIAVRWSWLLILGAALGAAGGYYYSKGQQPVYQASTRAMLMRAPLEQSSDLTYYSDLQLVQTYLQRAAARTYALSTTKGTELAQIRQTVAVQSRS